MRRFLGSLASRKFLVLVAVGVATATGITIPVGVLGLAAAYVGSQGLVDAAAAVGKAKAAK